MSELIAFRLDSLDLENLRRLAAKRSVEADGKKLVTVSKLVRDSLLEFLKSQDMKSK